MSNSGKQWKLGAIMLGSYMLLGISTASIAETQLTVENDGLALTAIASSSKDILSTSIRVVGPDGFVFEDRFEDSTLQWVPEGNLADGRYNWEVRTVTVTPGAPIIEISAPQAPAPNPTGQEAAGESSATPANPEQPTVEIPIERYFEEADKRVHTESGSFQVRDGLMVPNINEQEAISRLEPVRPGLLGSIAGAMIDFVFPSAHADQVIADDLTLSEATPCLRYDDTTTVGIDWNMCVFDGDGYAVNNGSNAPPTSSATFAIEEGAPNSSLFVRSNGNIGFGTSTPSADLHIVDGLPAIRFDDSTDAQIWNLGGEGNFGGRFFVNDATAGTTPFRIDAGAPTDALRVAANGNVGIGTGTPTDPLHISESNGFQIRLDNGGTDFARLDQFAGFLGIGSNTNAFQFRMDNTAPNSSLFINGSGNVGIGTSAPSVAINALRSSGGPDLSMFRLENDGGNRFEFVNTRPGVGGEWQFINSSNPDGADLVIRELTSNAQEEFRLEQNGNLTISGTLTQGSSRAIKSNIVPLNGSDVLANLAKIEFAEWSYDNSPNQRHAGPMAEEFHEVFGLGPDNKHIAPGDMAGLALAAAKALVAQNEQQQDRIQAQEERITELESQNQAIRSSLHELRVLRVEVEQLKASWPSILVALEN